MITKPIPDDYEPAKTLEKVVKDEEYHRKQKIIRERERYEKEKIR